MKNDAMKNGDEIKRYSYIIAVVFILSSLFFWRTDITVSVLFGAIVSIFGFSQMVRILSKLIAPSTEISGKGAGALAAFFSIIRLTLFTIATIMLLRVGVIQGVALAVGLFVIPASIFTWFVSPGRHAIEEDYERAY